MSAQPLPQWIKTDHHREIYQSFDYVPGVIASGSFAFISGQVGLEDDRTASGDPRTQIERAFANLGTIVDAVPATPRQVVDITTFHVGLQDTMEVVGEAKKRFFGDWNPAWTAIGVAELAVPELIFEIRAVVRCS
ncbi:MAG: Rid family hydrolase [Planctomycetota bacterium]